MTTARVPLWLKICQLEWVQQERTQTHDWTWIYKVVLFNSTGSECAFYLGIWEFWGGFTPEVFLRTSFTSCRGFLKGLAAGSNPTQCLSAWQILSWKSCIHCSSVVILQISVSLKTTFERSDLGGLLTGSCLSDWMDSEFPSLKCGQESANNDKIRIKEKKTNYFLNFVTQSCFFDNGDLGCNTTM